MSCPTVMISLLNGKETGRVFHNWGWVSPSDFEVGMRIVKIVTGTYDFYDGTRLGEFDTIEVPFFGKLSKDNYIEMYYHLKDIYDKIQTKDTFKILDYVKKD